MKIAQLILCLLILLVSCQRETSNATGWEAQRSDNGGRSVSRKSKTTNGNTNTPQQGVIDGVYIKEHTPTKKVIPYQSIREANGTKLGTSFQPEQAGKLTCGEQNDLSEWEFWNDLTTDQLLEQSILWDISISNRMTFLVQNNQGIPVVNANIQLFGKSTLDLDEHVLWSGKTDNTGFAYLFAGLTKQDTNLIITRATIRHNENFVELTEIISHEKGINQVTLDAKCNQDQIADIAFVVDATGSMEDEIDFLKQDLLDIIQSAAELNPEAEINLAALFYRCPDNEYVTRHSDFSSNHTKTFDFILEQNADEGGQEVVEQALDEAINQLSWRENATSKLIFIILDEAPGQSEEINQKMKAAYADAARKGIKIIPCVASGIGHTNDRNLEYIMRAGAIATNGTYVFFTNDSGIGNNHTTPLVKSYEVKSLNALLKKIISDNLYLAACETIDSPISAYADEQNNSEEELMKVLDILSINGEDSLIASILPYTIYETDNELNKNRPLTQLDTTSLLENNNIDIISMRVHPLPTTSDITVKITHIPDSYTLMDGHGRIIQHISKIDSREFSVDLLNLPRGQYFLRVAVGETILQSRIPKL